MRPRAERIPERMMTTIAPTSDLASLHECGAILDDLARGVWRRRYGPEAECPEHRIPTAAALADWLPRCGAWAAVEARLAEIGLAVPMAVEESGKANPIFVVLSGAEAITMLAYAGKRYNPPNPERVARLWARLVSLLVRDSVYTDGADVLADAIEYVHGAWAGRLHRWPEGKRPKHPIAAIVDSWQSRSGQPIAASTVSTVRGLVRRDARVSRVLRTPWESASVDAALVDGEPMATRFPDATAVFGERPKRRTYRPTAQRRLGLRGVAEIPTDLRLSALSEIAGGPTVLAGDVLALMNLAHASDHPVTIRERDGAALLARSRDGGFRRVRESDVKRFWQSAAALHGLLVHERGTGRWANLARVDPLPESRAVMIGAPEWMRGKDRGRWTLTADGGIAARARQVAGEAGGSGRIITALEHYLGAYYPGRGKGLSPYLRAANGKGSAGPVVSLPWRTVMDLAGFAWDQRSAADDHAMLLRYRRCARRLARAGYCVQSYRAEAAAGDTVEIVEVVRSARTRPAGLRFRASARFCEAARLANLAHGKGFATVALGAWLGLPAAAE